MTAKIHILTPGFTSPNGAAFLYPLIKFSCSLRASGFNIHFHDTISPILTQCDYLLIDSKYFKSAWAQNFDQTLENIANLSAQTKTLWCDQNDSTGTLLGQVAPHVHRYLKAQLLKDRTEYMKSHYAARIYADYYHRTYGVSDEEPYIDQPIKNENDLNKLCLSWCSAFMHYGVMGPYLLRLREHLPFNGMLHFQKPLRRADAPRPNDMTCRMGIPYSRASMRFQREQIRKLLKNKLPTNKISRQMYFQEMQRSKICISPFGLGEITLKDFECFLSGALLIKPDMSHMETWPNLFQDKMTCLFHNWDLDDLQSTIDWALSHEKERIAIAQSAQDLYAAHTTGKDAANLFTQYFSGIIR